MAKKLVQKTFKLEIEVTVSMDEVGEAHLNKGQDPAVLASLQQLQTALLEDEPTLINQMQAVLLGKLQNYIDLLVSQDHLESLAKLVKSLEPEDREYFEGSKDYLADITRALRTSSMHVSIDRSDIAEGAYNDEGDATWQRVWSDLRLRSGLGCQLDQYRVPDVSIQPGASQDSHHLLARHLTLQNDGVHFEGCCTCSQFLEGVGEDENEALEGLWRSYRKHVETVALARSQITFWKAKPKNPFSKD